MLTLISAIAIMAPAPSTATSTPFFDIPAECMMGQYRLALFTNASVPVGLAAVPVDNEDCPELGLNAVFGDDMTTIEKHWEVLTDDDFAMMHRMEDEKSYLMSDIEDAYMIVEMRAPRGDLGLDAVRENLAFFPLAILIFLGEDADSSELFDWAMIVDPPQTLDAVEGFHSLEPPSTVSSPTPLPPATLTEVENHNVAEIDFQVSTSDDSSQTFNVEDITPSDTDITFTPPSFETIVEMESEDTPVVDLHFPSP